jgi:hypothetical protein
MLSKPIERGSYLLEITGTFVCAVAQKHDLVFTIDVDGQKFELATSMHTSGGYGYPFAIRKEFVATHNGELKVTATHKNNQAFQMYQNIISISPMIKIN